MSKMARIPIQKKLQRMVLLISVIAVVSISAIGIFTLHNIKAKSIEIFVDQIKLNLSTVAYDKSIIADLELSRFESYINANARYLYLANCLPQDFARKEVSPPNKKLGGGYSMQRYLKDKSIKYADVKNEMSLYGNIEYFWDTMMQRDGNVITTIYIGTESGFLISYDKSADIAEVEADGESYYDYKKSYWYESAKVADDVIFTDLTQDSYGRGLTLTCAAPFYNKNDEICGVVAMDILVTDLQKNIIDMDLGDGIYAFIVNGMGDIVASPYVDLKQKDFENIKYKDSIYHEISNDILSGKEGIAHLKGNIYCAYAPTSIANWTLCIYVPENIVSAPANLVDKSLQRMMIVFIISFIIICLLVVLVVKNFSRKLTMPLLILRNEVEVISEGGDFDKVVTVVGNDEISDLAKTFNNMTSSLKKYIHDLTYVTAEKERIGAELNVATQIQSSMLPSIFPDDKRFDIYASMNPAKEVGGDFYDFFMIDDSHIAIVVADVSGKGVPAALFMVIGKTLIKDHTTLNNNLGDVFTEVNKILCEANSEGLFITAFEAVIDLEIGKVVFVNAGHELPYIYRKGKEFSAFEMKHSFVLAGLDSVKYSAGEFFIEPGDKIFQYTDGVTEATNEKNELYGMDRLKIILDKCKNKNPKETLINVKEDIDKFVGGAPQFDDITMLCFEFIKKGKLK